MGCSSSKDEGNDQVRHLEEEENYHRYLLMKEYVDIIMAECPFSAQAIEKKYDDKPATGDDGEEMLIIIQDKVVDCSKWMHIHPGGKQSIVNYAGKECTSAFMMMHSKRAIGMLPTYNVATVVDISLEEFAMGFTADAADKNDKEKKRALVPTKASTVPPGAALASFAAATEYAAMVKSSGGKPAADDPARKAKARAAELQREHTDAVAKFTGLGKDEFTTAVKCVKVDKLTHNTKYLEFALADEESMKAAAPTGRRRPSLNVSFAATSSAQRLPLLPGGHVSLRVPTGPDHKDDAHCVYRSYSPVTILPGRFGIVVKVYDGGKGSGYLHELAAESDAELGVKQQVLFRGPVDPLFSLYSALPTLQRLTLFAGGTGAAPHLSIARAVVAHRGEFKNIEHVSLVLCFSTESDMLLVEEAQQLEKESNGACTAHVAFSRLPEKVATVKGVKRLHRGRVTKPMIEEVMGKDHVERKQKADGQVAVVCGPPGFNRNAADLLAAMGFAGSDLCIME